MSEAGPPGRPDTAPGGGAVPAAAGVMNAANALTVIRMLLVPAFVAFLAAGGTGYRYAAFTAFAVASVTDLADGELARRRNLITDFGKIADPIADKALTGSALVTLSALDELACWVTVVILARELAVTALRFWVIRRGVIAASRGGKVKTLLQVVAISLYILPGPALAVREAFMGAAVAVTVVTGLDYLARAWQLHRAVPGHPPGPDCHRPASRGPDTAGRDSPGPDTPGADSPGRDSPGLDTPGLDTPGLDSRPDSRRPDSSAGRTP